MDTFGRRSLLLMTFPFLAAFQFMMAGVTGYEATVAAMYMFCAAYSVGEGPVPFVSPSPDLKHVWELGLMFPILGVCF